MGEANLRSRLSAAADTRAFLQPTRSERDKMLNL